MGKKRDRSTVSSAATPDPFLLDVETTSSLHISGTEDEGPPSKKPKKHKKKKSSKKEKPDQGSDQSLSEGKSIDESTKDESLFCDTDGTKLVTHKTSDTSLEKNSKTPKSKSEKSKSSSSSKIKRKKDGGKAGDDDTDSEEERWLDAIESGKLEEVDDELKRMKNPRLMTARQRALMEKRSDGVDETFLGIPAEPLLALPSGFKEKVVTEEMLAKKAMKSKRRREQAIEKREEDKKKTVDRLLKKQDPKTSKGSRSKVLKKSVPLMSYFNNREGIFLSIPDGVDIPFFSKVPEWDAPKPVLCGGPGCLNIKKYSCSKTGVPLCSLECYKRNLEVTSQSVTLVS